MQADTTRPSFLMGGGELASLIASHDWSGSLGPVESWPQSLKTVVGLMIHSPVPLVLLWGTDGIMLYNDAYSVFAGGRHPQLLGSRVVEGWPEVADFNAHVMTVGLAGGTLSYKNQELSLNRTGIPLPAWMDLDYSPVPDESGRPGGVIAVVVETTERVLAERCAREERNRLAESEARLQMALSAGNGVGTYDWDIQADRVVADARFARLYGVDPDKAQKGAPIAEFFAGIHPDDLGHTQRLIGETLETGKDFSADYRLVQPDGSLCWVRAQGRCSRDADGTPLHFSGVTFDITSQVRERTRLAALAKLADAIRDQDDPEDLAFAAAEILGRALDVSRAGYGTIDPKAETVTIARDWNAPGVRSLAGVLHFRDYGSYIEDLRQGETVVICDAHGDPRVKDTAAALEGIGALSFVNMPVNEQGGLVALLYLNNATPREWSEEEIAFIREVAERTRTAVERRRAERRNAAEQERQRRLFAQMPGFVGVLAGPEHVYEYVNAAYLTLTGDRGFVGKTVRQALPELEGQGFFELLDQVYATGRAYVGRGIPAKLAGDTSDRFIDFVYEPVRDEAGAVTGIFVGGYDVTEAYRALGALRESEAQFQSFAQAMANHVWAATPDGQLYWLNQQTYSYSGAPDGSLTGNAWIAIVHPDDVQTAAAAWSKVLATGNIYEAEFRLRRHDGAWRWHIARAVPIRDDNGDVVRWIGTNTDIQDQKEAADALRALNANLEQEVVARSMATGKTWQVSPDLLGVANAEGYFENSNPSWQTMLGWSQEEIARTPLLDLVHPDDLTRTQECLQALIRGDDILNFENRYRRKDGSYTWISWVAVPDNGKFYCSGRNITLEKEREAQLAQTEDALRQAQKMEAVGQLTGGIAHDFNNLLQGITGALDRVQHRLADGRTGDVDRFLKAAVESANRAAALTHRLLAFSRRQTLDPRPTDANRLIGGMEELIRRTMGPDIAVEVVGAAGLWPVRVDPSQLENSLLNLCINARDAMPHGGKLTIETANKWLDERAARERELAPGQYVSLCVTDTGTGMAPEVISRAFDPFFTTKPLGQGTGLGLSMIYGFVRQSGGQVRVYSEIEKGTTMCLYFPRHFGVAVEDGPAVSEMVERGFGETVLVVDDEPTVRMLVAEVLSENFYNVLEAGDGPSALKLLQSDRRIDLMITDVGLPGGMNGRQVADAARAVRNGLKVLFITGYAENAAIANGHLERGMEILAKPFAMSTLANKVREMIET